MENFLFILLPLHSITVIINTRKRIDVVSKMQCNKKEEIKTLFNATTFLLSLLIDKETIHIILVNITNKGSVPNLAS